MIFFFFFSFFFFFLQRSCACWDYTPDGTVVKARHVPLVNNAAHLSVCCQPIA